MVKIKIGNILEAEENIIVHQVNTQGIMGGGVARQLALQYPNLEKEYSEFCKLHNNSFNELKGQVFKIMLNGKFIMNMFSQEENFNTNYEAMKKGLNTVKEYAGTFNLSVCMPYKIRLWNCKWRLEYSL